MERNRKVDHPMCGSRVVGRVHLSAVGCDEKSLLVLQQPVVRRVSCRAARGCSAATDTAGRRWGWSASTEHTRPSQLWSSSFSASSCVESSSLCTSLSLPASLAGSQSSSASSITKVWRRHWRPVGADPAGRHAVPSSRRPCLRCRCLRARSGWLRRQGAVLVVLLVEPVLQPIWRGR